MDGRIMRALKQEIVRNRDTSQGVTAISRSEESPVRCGDVLGL